MSTLDPSKISKAFSDKNRLKIMQMLSEGERNVGSVAESLNVEENLASHHLRVLSAMGFLKSKKRGRQVYYKINRMRMVRLLRDLRKNELFKDIIEESLSEK